MKKYLVYLLILISLFSCFQNSSVTVSKFLDDVKLKKIEDSKKYVSNPEMLAYFDLNYKNDTQKIFIDELLNNFSYEIQNTIKREDKTEIVNVKIENIDVNEMFFSIYKRLFKKILQANGPVDVKDVFLDLLKEKKYSKKSTITQFLIIKEKGNKKIFLRKENVDDIFGGYFTTLNEINNE